MEATLDVLNRLDPQSGATAGDGCAYLETAAAKRAGMAD